MDAEARGCPARSISCLTMGQIGHAVTMSATERTNKAEAPPRRSHRRSAPFVDRESGKPFPLSRREIAAQAQYAPVRAIVRVLAGDEDFLTGIAAIREPGDSDWAGLERWLRRGGARHAGEIDTTIGEAFGIDQLARRYVRKEGQPLRLVRHIIRLAVESELKPPQNVLVIAAKGSAVSEHDAAEWTHAKRLPEVAAMLGRLGRHQCLACGEQLHGSKRRYCSGHIGQASFRERPDSEAISSLLVGAASALGVN